MSYLFRGVELNCANCEYYQSNSCVEYSFEDDDICDDFISIENKENYYSEKRTI